MILFILRIVWRTLIFLLGVGALVYIVRAVWPDDTNQAAILGALLFTYCLMAYVVIPNLMRLFHVFSRPDHIPLYVTTGDGWPSDPINIAIIARSRKKLEKTMQKAGWHIADPLTFRNGLRELIAIIFNKPYPEAPLSNLYLFDRPQDISFELPANSQNSPRTRHHVRFWQLKEPTKKPKSILHYKFWKQKILDTLGISDEIWIGSATEDHAVVGIQWRTGQITHGVSHDADRERDFVIQSLKDTGKVSKITTSKRGRKLKFHGQLFHLGKKHIRMSYTTNGSIKVIHLKKL